MTQRKEDDDDDMSTVVFRSRDTASASSSSSSSTITISNRIILPTTTRSRLHNSLNIKQPTKVSSFCCCSQRIHCFMTIIALLLLTIMVFGLWTKQTTALATPITPRSSSLASSSASSSASKQEIENRLRGALWG